MMWRGGGVSEVAISNRDADDEMATPDSGGTSNSNISILSKRLYKRIY